MNESVVTPPPADFRIAGTAGSRNRSTIGAGLASLFSDVSHELATAVLVGTLWTVLPGHLWAGFLAAAAFQLVGAGVLVGLRRRSA